jgi:hypothetical protein
MRFQMQLFSDKGLDEHLGPGPFVFLGRKHEISPIPGCPSNPRFTQLQAFNGLQPQLQRNSFTAVVSSTLELGLSRVAIIFGFLSEKFVAHERAFSWIRLHQEAVDEPSHPNACQLLQNCGIGAMFCCAGCFGDHGLRKRIFPLLSAEVGRCPYCETDYAPSQYLCEFIKKCGYDRVIYRSSVSEGLNPALFDPAKAERGDVSQYRVERVSVDITRLNERANPET